jgi:hypothetical protein
MTLTATPAKRSTLQHSPAIRRAGDRAAVPGQQRVGGNDPMPMQVARESAGRADSSARSDQDGRGLS